MHRYTMSPDARRGTFRLRRDAVRQAVLLFVTSGLGMQAAALPQNPSVVAGQVNIRQQGAGMVMQQGSQRAIVNWQSFSSARGESIVIQQPGGNSAMLARVTGGLGPSSLAGSLSANGQFFLINPQGIIVGKDAVINTGAFVASTLGVTDREFLAGNGLNFSGDSFAGIVNLGTIQATSGPVALVSRSILNEGNISAPRGSAVLAAGTDVFLSTAGTPQVLIRSRAGDGAAGTGVDNQGLIEAARVQLQAASGDLYSLAINQAGTIRATGYDMTGGRVVLTADGGTVRLAGTTVARNADGSGGEILAGGGARGMDPAVANAAVTQVTTSAVLDASAAAAKGDGGKVVVWSNNATTLEGRISAAAGLGGGNGGMVEVSSRKALDFRPASVVDLSAHHGKAGNLLLDPDSLTIGSIDGVNQISAATLAGQLASGSITLDTSSAAGDISFVTDLAWASGNTLTVRSGNNININAGIDAGVSGALELYAGLRGKDLSQQNPALRGDITVSPDAAITAGRLTLGANALAAVTGYQQDSGPVRTGTFSVDGKLDVGTLELDLSTAQVGVVATHAQNRIGTLQTTGTGDLGYVNVLDTEGGLGVRLASANSSSSWVQAVTPGDLTVLAGSQLSFSGPATVVLASTGGNVINQAGASALQADAALDKRFLIYTGSTSGTVKDGLTGTDEFNRTWGLQPPEGYTDSASRFLYRSGGITPTLTYKADDKTRLYGDANPLLTYSIFNTGTPVDESSLAGFVTGSPSLSTMAVPTAGVADYAITIGRGTLDSASYDFDFVNGKLTVSPAPLAVSAVNASRFYGDANPVFSASVTGLKNGESADSILSGITLSSAAGNNSNAGQYGITLGTASVNPNYSYTLSDATLTVNPAPVTITLPGLAREYGDANPDFLLQASASGLKNFQSLLDAFPSLGLSSSADALSPVGSYAVTASGLSNPNYAITAVLNPLQVTPAPLTVQASSGSRLYGDANPSLTASMTGFKNGQDAGVVSGLSVATAATVQSGVGSYAVTAAGAAAENYSFHYLDGNLAVTPAPLEVRGDDKSRLFGQENPAFTWTVSGLRNGDEASGISFSTSATALSGVGNHAINGGGSMANYAINFTPGTLHIGKAPVTLTAGNASKTYGDANPPLGFTASGLLASDLAYLGYWRATTTADARSNAGAHAIQVGLNPDAGPLATLFTNLPNYDVQFVSGTLTINKAPLVLLAQPASATWGSARPDFSYIVNGLKPWDSAAVLSGVTLASAADGIVSTPNNPAPLPGTYAVTFSSTGNAQNYSVVNAVPSSFQVTPRPYVITVPDVIVQAGQVPGTFSYNAPVQFGNGPKFSIIAVSNAPGGTGAGPGVYALQAYLPDVRTDAQLADITRYYAIDISKPGRLTVLPAPPVFPLESVRVEMPPLPAEPAPPVVARSGPLVLADMADLLRSDSAAILETIKAFMKAPDNGYNNGYSEAFIALSPQQKEALLQLLYGSSGGISMDEAAARLATDPVLRAALAPVFAAYAMSLVSSDKPLSPVQQRLLGSVTEKLNEQRARVAATAQKKYDEWLAVQGDRGLLTLTSSNVPDIIGAARQELMTDVLLKAGSIVAGSVAIGEAVTGTAFALVAAIFPYSHAFIAVGPVGAAVAAAVAIGAIAGDQAVKSQKNLDNFNAFIENNKPVTDLRSLNLNDGGTKFDVFTAITGVLGDAFKP